MRLPPMLAGTRPAPPPPPMHTRAVLLTGTAMWFVAFVVLLPFWNWLGEHDHRIWLWTCLAGWLLGLVGFAIYRKHRGEGRVVD